MSTVQTTCDDCGQPYAYMEGGRAVALRCSQCREPMCRNGSGSCPNYWCAGIADRYDPTA